MNQNYSRFLTITGLVGLVLIQTACSSSRSETVQGKVTVVDRMKNALTRAQLLSVQGRYVSGCDEHTPGGAWSVPVSDLTVNSLYVVLNDPDCLLSIDAVTTSTNGSEQARDVLTTVPTAMPLTDDFGTARAFGDPAAFFANAEMSALGFTEDFGITFLYSDDPSQVAATNTADFAVSETSVFSSRVPAPAVTLGIDGVLVTVDAANEFVSASGVATTVDATPVGDGGANTLTYTVVVNEATDLDTYAQVNAAYLAALIPTALGDDIPAGEFALTVEGEMPQTRRLIIANTVEGVRSYTVFTIQFLSPEAG